MHAPRLKRVLEVLMSHWIRQLFGWTASASVPALPAPARTSVSPTSLKVEAHIPAERLQAITEELNMRIQAILVRASLEDAQALDRSTLVVLGLRSDAHCLPGSTALH